VALYVGTSGWAYPEWRGSVYPAGLAQGRFLEHYGTVFTACEVNGTFYRLQPPAALARWAAATPAPFRFAVKAHRRLTHRRRLAPDPATAAFAREFLGSLAPLGDKLGCVLLQVPESVERDDAGLDALLDLLPDGLPFACELQHESWWAREVAEAVAGRGGTTCLREERGVAPPALPPGPFAYVRLKGAHYPEGECAALVGLLDREAAERDVYAFARHKDVPADDPHVGPGLARRLVSP
jgi:uncharacterized protein YecE (DUF72 family)